MLEERGHFVHACKEVGRRVEERPRAELVWSTMTKADRMSGRAS